MSNSPEIDTFCPRTGIPCPFLVDCVESIHTARENIEQRELEYIDGTITNALQISRLDALVEAGELDLSHDYEFESTKKASESWKAYERALADSIDAENRVITHEEEGMETARKTCLIGPRVMRKNIVYGEKALRCTSLLAIMNRDQE